MFSALGSASANYGVLPSVSIRNFTERNIMNISIIKISRSLNTTIYLDVIKETKQLHVSARGHLQVVSCGFARKCFLQRPVIYNDRRGRGGRDLVLQSLGFFFVR
jgi:hypothetical protein